MPTTSYLCTLNEPHNLKLLYERFYNEMLDDFKIKKYADIEYKNALLYELDKILFYMDIIA